MAAVKKTETVQMVLPEIVTYRVRLVGETPLIVHAWSEKAKRMMLEAQQGVKKTKKKEFRRPFLDFYDALYWITEKPEDPGDDEELKLVFADAVRKGAKFGFPASAIKQCANATAYRKKFVPSQMGLRGAWFINSPYGELVEIKSEEPPVMRQDPVKIGAGTPDLRYRPMFEKWSIDLDIDLDVTGQYDINFIIGALNHGGYGCGLGEWRIEKDGDFGRFRVESAE